MKDNIVALLRGSIEPTEVQFKKIEEFVKKNHDADSLKWINDEEIQNGFILEIGSQIYDWTIKGKLDQFEDYLKSIHKEKDSDFMRLVIDGVKNWDEKVFSKEVGYVEEVGDGIAQISGIPNVTYGEIIKFENGQEALANDIQPNLVGCIIFGKDDEIQEGMQVVRTGKIAGIGVSSRYLGRVVDPLGNPIDGEEELHPDTFYPIEKEAPEILDRKSVDRPLQTGILAIDSMFPIGKGQRELIIGDRQTGKTAIALDTIVNQKGKNVICVYVAIGQKSSSIAQIVDNLKKRDALEYTVIVASTASQPASLQYIAPYSGTAIAEYFMDQGKDVLIVYDDLSKHAVAYRTISLLLGRSPGREAYPGDVFYLHSRLLERSSQLSDEKGGGSITALPIVETQAGDVSAYIPTNIISITDGQIFLESDLFFSGQRPAVNVGLSVSRVGGAAQTKAIKKATSTLRLELAQYREIEIFTQFSSDLDDSTKKQLKFGKVLMELLKQNQYSPMKQTEQVITLIIGLEKLLIDFDIKDVKNIMNGIIEYIREQKFEIINEIKTTNDFTPEIKEEIISLAKEYLERRK